MNAAQVFTLTGYLFVGPLCVDLPAIQPNGYVYDLTAWARKLGEQERQHPMESVKLYASGCLEIKKQVPKVKKK